MELDDIWVGQQWRMLHCEDLIKEYTNAILDWMHVAAEHCSFEGHYFPLRINGPGDRIDIGLGDLGAIDEKASTLPEDRAYIWFGDGKYRNIAGFDVRKERYEIITQNW